MLKEILDNCQLEYQRAFAYLRKSNLPSVKTMNKIGAKEIKRFDIRGLFRRFYDNSDGEFILYQYKKAE